MSFLDTQPAEIHLLQGYERWERFRVGDPRQMMAALHEFCRRSVPLTLGAAGTPLVVAAIWAVDERQNTLSFNLPPEAAPHVDALVGAPELWAAGYLDDAKVQFECAGLRVERSGAVFTLRCDLPRLLYSLPRRTSVRVRRALALAPVVLFNHPVVEHTRVRMLVMDISVTGCALWRAAPDLPLQPGAVVPRAQVQLDHRQGFIADLLVQHMTQGADPRAGMRIGCAWDKLPAYAAKLLENWISRGRRRRELLSLDL
jgi:c-di-GMP-binding flagellar brake protein YcgR